MRALVLDTETNGYDGAEREIIEFSCFPVSEPYFCAEGLPILWRFKPKKESTVGALSVHHILGKELEHQAPSSECTLPEGTSYIIGHGIDYDWEALQKPEVKRICTLAISRALFPDIASHRLGAMMYYLFPHEHAREQLKYAHSADANTLMCHQLLTVLLLGNPEIQTFEALWEFSERCRMPTTFTFGKHKGMLIKDTLLGYRQWCLRQPDFDPYVLKAIRESMKGW